MHQHGLFVLFSPGKVGSRAKSCHKGSPNRYSVYSEQNHVTTLKNTLTTHISRISSSCNIFSMMSTSKRCLVTFFHSLRTHPQILKDLSKSHDQTQGFFFWPFQAWGHGSSRGKAVTTHKNSKFIKQTSLDFLLQMIEMHTHAKQFFC